MRRPRHHQGLARRRRSAGRAQTTTRHGLAMDRKRPQLYGPLPPSRRAQRSHAYHNTLGLPPQCPSVPEGDVLPFDRYRAPNVAAIGAWSLWRKSGKPVLTDHSRPPFALRDRRRVLCGDRLACTCRHTAPELARQGATDGCRATRGDPAEEDFQLAVVFPPWRAYATSGGWRKGNY